MTPTKPHYRRTADGRTYRLGDGFQNVAANLNTGRDKASHGTYSMRWRADNELVAAYRTAWLPKKIVNIIPDDATRRWREWQGKPNQVTALEAEEKRLGLQTKTRDSLRSSRLFGGSAVYIGTKDSDPSQPLDLDRLGKGGITHLTAISRLDLTPGEIDRTPGSINYGYPVDFQLGMVRIHPSRLSLFRGEVVPDWQLWAPNYWGDSVLLAVFDAMTQADSTGGNIASLVYEAQVDILHIPKLMEMLSKPGGDEKIMKYLASLALAKGNNGMLILDGGDTSQSTAQRSGGTEFDRKALTFAGLGDIWDRMMQAASGAADIPMTRLFGQSAAGMNATGENDLRNYYDRVQAMQELEFSPSMTNLDEALIRSALGERPSEIHYNWRPLWQETAHQKATTGKVVTDALKVLKDSTLYPDEVLQVAGTSAIVETGILPGLEGAVRELGGWDKIRKDMDAERESEAEEARAAAGLEDDPDPAGNGNARGRTVPPRRGITDAAPRSLYVSRRVLNGREILNWAKEQGFKNTLTPDDLHVTVVFSKIPVDWMKVGEAWQESLELPAGGPRIMEQFGRAKVLTFASSALQWRHQEAEMAGASWDHPEYQPHITISYDEDGPDISTIEPYRGRIVLGPEVFKELDPNWQPKEVDL